MSRDVATQQTVEILTALRKLGETLTPQEDAFLQTNSSSSLKAFEEVSGDIGEFMNMVYSTIILFFSHISFLFFSHIPFPNLQT